MQINADFSKRAAVHFNEGDWVPSPMGGVERRMLDRVGGEVARATTIVRFTPGSHFSAHTHDGGEEYLVLDGVFEDENGDFPRGSYVRNPPTTHHTPAASKGATILVKLHQFDPADRTEVHVDTAAAAWDGNTLPLHKDRGETVRLERWSAGERVAVGDAGGVEVFVLEGGYSLDGEEFAAWDWLRLPAGDSATITAGPNGAVVWVKSGHLAGASIDQVPAMAS